MAKQTPLYEEHVSAGAKMVGFAGWSMPVNYGSQIQEHVAVRTAAGMFDVSHMTIVDVLGPGAEEFLRRVVANNVSKLEEGGALYGALLNERGGVIDDLIVYRRADHYRCVVNASTRDKVLAWFDRVNDVGAELCERDLAMIAVQGPSAIDTLTRVDDIPGLGDLAPFHSLEHGDWLIGRTGYTGEDGVEVMLPGAAAVSLWRRLREAGVHPAGLGARDTLRLEAGLNLYGQDLDEDTSPLASNIGWTIAWKPEDREFIGRAAIEPERGGKCPQKLTGLVMRDKGVLRHGQRVVTGAGDGVITSGTYSPTLEYSIALARVPKEAAGECQVDIRGKLKGATIVKPPFVKNGKSLID
jgi:aminomethyltransferase